MPRSMHPEIRSMRVAQAAKRQRCIGSEGLARGLTELRTGKHGAIVGETDQALVECGVQEGRDGQIATTSSASTSTTACSTAALNVLITKTQELP